MMLYTVYKTVNLTNGKYYFGVHKTDDPDDDYLGSGVYIKRAVAKYGEQNFRKEVLFIYLDAESAFKKEDELIQCYRGRDPLCMNLKNGGRGGYDWINKNGLNGAKVAHLPNVEQQRRRTFGKRLKTDENFRRQVAERAKHAAQFVKNESRLESLKQATIAAANANTGRKRSSEFKHKISAAQRGGRWVHQGRNKRRVVQEDLPRFLKEGWLFGQKDKPSLKTRKLSKAQTAFAGTRWCWGHKDFLPLNAFDGANRLCRLCRKKRRVLRRQELGHW
jgi:hypothetical protein